MLSLRTPVFPILAAKRAEASAESAKELNRLVSVSSETKPLADLPDEFFQAFR